MARVTQGTVLCVCKTHTQTNTGDVIAAFDLTFGFEAKLGGNALSEGFFGSDETVSSPFSNNSYGGLQDHMPANSHSGGGGGYVNTWHLVLY